MSQLKLDVSTPVSNDVNSLNKYKDSGGDGFLHSLPVTICAADNCQDEISGNDVEVCDICERWFHNRCIDRKNTDTNLISVPSLELKPYICATCIKGDTPSPQIRRNRSVSI